MGGGLLCYSMKYGYVYMIHFQHEERCDSEPPGIISDWGKQTAALVQYPRTPSRDCGATNVFQDFWRRPLYSRIDCLFGYGLVMTYGSSQFSRRDHKAGIRTS